MAFFQSKPNLPAAEKAKVEFHLQQIAECVGFDRLALPVLSIRSLLELSDANEPVKQIVSFTGKHLSHDVSELQVTITPQQLEKCGSGG